MKSELEGEMYTLNPRLVEWAYRLTQRTALIDTDQIRKSRARFQGFPNALKPPFVAKGDTISGSTFWHGSKMDEWANGLDPLLHQWSGQLHDFGPWKTPGPCRR